MKLLRAGRHKSFYSFNLITDKVCDCLWLIFLPILIGRRVAVRPYKTLQQLQTSGD